MPIFLRRNAALWAVSYCPEGDGTTIVIVTRSPPEPTDLLANWDTDSYNTLIMKKPQTVNK
ncbi:hypothetical protein [Kamptonema sp. UHCC 0994]|uniref:hypothetical protein n=1 Tax=Kamptonema sp. UHCC 0994 TaxID=3031329 RepID=UPI0023B92021|nr:hypothetical protein [Kamptonema sp. UHCC 0994]